MDRILFTFRPPSSDILVSECTKEWARNEVRYGRQPKGSIWVPGCCEGNGARPEIGDLYGPDPEWKPARPLHAVPDDQIAWQRAA